MRGGLSFGLVGLLLGFTLLAPGAQASETVLFHKFYRSAVEGNKVETIPVEAGYDALRLTVNISAGSGFWSDVRGYASVTLVDPHGSIQFHRFGASVVPTATANACLAPEPARSSVPWCGGWTRGYVAHLAPTQGEWRLVEVHATPGISIFVTVDLVGITGA